MYTIRHWYECEGGKYILEAIGSVALAVVAIAVFVAAFPVSGFFAICGAIGAGLAVVNSVANVATSFEAAGAAVHDNPAWAMIYGKQDKLSDVLRQTNFGNGIANNLSNLGAGGLDTVETFCDIVGIVGMGADALKFFKGDAFKLLKNKDSLDFSDLKNFEKDGNVSLKNNIKQEYEKLTDDIKGLDKADDISKDLGNGIKSGSGSFGNYSTKIDSKVTVIDKQELPNSLVKTFKDSSYRTVVVNEDITVYRSFGYNAEAGGAFATSNPAISRIQAKVDSAILPEWKNTLRYEAEIVIPKGTTLNIGRVEEQFTMSGARLAGDADQFLLPQNWDLNWIKSIRKVKP